MIPIYKNTDTKINVTLKNKLGVPINLNTLTGIGIWLSYQDNSIFLKYSKNMTSVDNKNLSSLNFNQIKIVDAVSGQFSFVIEAKDTENAIPGVLNFSIKLQYTDSDISTGIFHNGKVVTYFGEILENVMQTQTNI